MKYFCVLFLLFSIPSIYSSNNENDGKPESSGLQVFTFKWDHVQAPYLIIIWILIAAFSKSIFRCLDTVMKYLPESSTLMVIGIIIGLPLKVSISDISYMLLDSRMFFLYLLPPIIFDAGYFMPNRAFFENLDSILLFSLVGTVWSAVSIGCSLYSLSYLNFFSINIPLTEIFVFSSLLSACDPVAVIAVFEEINVNEFLFVNVFGEALFNDGTSMVLYQLMTNLITVGSENLTSTDYIVSAGSFFVLSIGSVLMGIVFAAIACYVTKTTHKAPELGPIFFFVIPYACYLTAEMTSLSSLIAIAICGMVMKQYIKENLSNTSAAFVKKMTKVFAQGAETITFLFLGLSIIYLSSYQWDFTFIAATVFFCLLWRTVGVVAQCFILNKFRKKKFTTVDQIILSYGGLRGAIAFGLSLSIPESIQARQIFITATISMVFFSVVLQGITIRPLVNYLKIETKPTTRPNMMESVYMKCSDYTISGLENIAAQRGHNSFRQKFECYNSKYIRPLLIRDLAKSPFDASTIVRTHERLELDDKGVKPTI